MTGKADNQKDRHSRFKLVVYEPYRLFDAVKTFAEFLVYRIDEHVMAPNLTEPECC